MKLVGTTERTELVTKPRWVTTTEEETFDVYLIELSSDDLRQFRQLVFEFDLRQSGKKELSAFYYELEKCLK